MTQLQAMLLSIAIETPIVVLLVRRARWSNATTSWLVGLGIAATALTHPVVWLGTPLLEAWVGPWAARVAITETFAWTAEAALYAWALPLSAGRALALSGVANAVSFGIGLGLWWAGLL